MSQKRRNSTGLFGSKGAIRGTGEKAQNFMAGLQRLLKYLSLYKFRVGMIVFLALFSTLFNTLGPKILSLATDELADGIAALMTGDGSIDFTYVYKILSGLLLLYLISLLFSFAMTYIIAGLTADISYGLRQQLADKINRLPLSYFNETSTGDVLSRITNDVDIVSQMLNQSVTQILTSIVTLTGVILVMLTINWQLTIVALLIVPSSLVIIRVITKRSQQYFIDQRDYLGTVNAHVEEMYGGHLVIKAFNGEQASIEKFNQENEKLCQSTWKADFRSGLMQPFIGFISNLSYVAVCIFGAWLTAQGQMTIGGIQAFIQYVRSLGHPIANAASISANLQQMVAAAERVFVFLDAPEESYRPPLVTTAQLAIKGDIDFAHVSFAYDDSDKLVINDFTAHIRAGQKVAIVGPTGAGKTTIVKLLMRFYDLKGGAICLDGHNITSFDRHDLRSKFAMVLQDTWLFSGSIMENIRYGRPEATDEQVVAAAKAAQVHHFIRTLPDGYNMQINEESTNISQGQKQLLTIARAILSDARIMILDEATSSVDTRTELLLQKAMSNLLEGRTGFIIAHRLSTIRNADLILFMQDGDIVEQGTHDELLKRNGFYAQLYNSQFEQIAV